MRTEFQITNDEAGARLQDVLAARYPMVSVGALRRLMTSGHVWLKGALGTRNMLVATGDGVEIDLPEEGLAQTEPRRMKLEVLYEDASCVAINKPAGIAVVPERQNEDYALMSGMLYYLQHDSPRATGELVRPMIVHRLDKDTTGVLVIARTLTALRVLTEQFSGRKVSKEYLAIVRGRPPAEAELSFPLTAKGARAGRILVDDHHGRPSQTIIRTEEYFQGYALVRAFPKTGRTHQVRVHLMAAGFPLVVDPLYSGRPARIALYLSELKQGYRQKAGFEERPLISRQALHAHRLEFDVPAADPGQMEHVAVEAPLPDDMELVLKMLRKWKRERGGNAEC